MAVCLIYEETGVTREQYDRVRMEVAGDQAPAGALYHVAGPTDDGWYVVEVWESREALDRFVGDKLAAALQKHGMSGQPRVFEVDRIMHP
jgi:hypothetical protein